MNILVLGGNRFFGKKVLQLICKNKKNFIYVINRNNKKNIKKTNIEFFNCDRSDYYKLKKYLKNKKIDVIFDNIAYKLKDVKVILRAIDYKIEKYIFSSTVISEFFKKRLKNINSLKKQYIDHEISYAKKKFQIEKYLEKQNKINYIILNIHSVIDFDDFSEKTHFLFNINEEIFKYYKIKSKDSLQFIYKQDLAKIIRYIILSKNIKNLFLNIASDPITYGSFLKILKNKSRKNKKNFTFQNKKFQKFPFARNLLIQNDKLKKLLPFKLTENRKVINKIKMSIFC